MSDNLTTFKPVNEISDRDELIDINNYWQSTIRLMKKQNTEPNINEKIEKIKEYLEQLKLRNKQIQAMDRSKRAKERAEEMRRIRLIEEAEEEKKRIKQQKHKEQFEKDYPAFLQQSTEIQNEINQLQASMDILNNSLRKLKKEFSKKCVHNYGYETCDIYGNKRKECQICGYVHINEFSAY